MRTIVVYHKNCSDGTASAWAAQRYMKANKISCEYIPADYSDKPVEAIGAVVILVDFSYPADVVRKLIEANNTVVIIDHHKSAIEKLATVVAEYDINTNANVNTKGDAWLLDTSRCGAVLTWQYFFPTKDIPVFFPALEIPEILLYVEDRDLWKKVLHRTDDISWVLKAYSDTIQDFDDLYELWYNKGLDSAANKGAGIYKFVQSQVKQIAEQRQEAHICIGETDLADLFAANWLKIPVVNANYIFSSDICEELMRITYSPIAMSYFRQADGNYKFSIRCNDSVEGSAKYIAEMFKGGGHPNAAGFYLNEDQYKKLMTEPTEEQTGIYNLEGLKEKKEQWLLFVQTGDEFGPISNVASDWTKYTFNSQEELDDFINKTGSICFKGNTQSQVPGESNFVASLIDDAGTTIAYIDKVKE